MPVPTVRPAADPLDDLDREQPVDSTMDRQDRADLPGQRSDQPGAGGNADRFLDAAREVVQEQSTDRVDLDDHEGSRVPLDDDDVADLGLARDNLRPLEQGQGADDDDPIDETEREGDDSIR